MVSMKKFNVEVRGFRIIISVIYTIIEVLRTPDLEDTAEQTDMREQFLEELGEPIVDGELPAVVIFQQVLSVASDKSSTIPTKKILLLLWKIILVNLLFLGNNLIRRDRAKQNYVGLQRK